jgi:hypothetical protein
VHGPVPANEWLSLMGSIVTIYCANHLEQRNANRHSPALDTSGLN